MPRLQLTDEEVKLIQEHRRKNEVRDAWVKAVEWCHEFLMQQKHGDLTAAAIDMLSAGRDVVLVEPRRKKP